MPYRDTEKRREYQREYMRRWYQANKSKHIGYVRSREKKIKVWLNQYKGTLCCEVCGVQTAKLKFQHKDPQTKKFYIGDIRDCSSIKALQEEIAKCRVLCPACFYRLNFADAQASLENAERTNDSSAGATADFDRKQSRQLGMSYGTAAHRLRKLVLFDALRRHDENVCFRCGLSIESAAELSIEHKQPWLDVSADLFWDLSNIAFSHLCCNRPNRPISERWKKRGPDGTAWCTRCKQFLSIEIFKKDKKRWNGLSDYCTPCHTRRHKEWRQRIASIK